MMRKLAGCATIIRFYLLVIVVLLGGFAIHSPSDSFAADVTLLTPKPDTTVTSRRVSKYLILMISSESDVEQLKVRKVEDNTSYEPVQVEDDGDNVFFHFRVSLKKGTNTFEVNPIGKTFKVTFRPIRTVRSIDFSDKTVHSFHRDESLVEVCMTCHEGQDDFSEIEDNPLGTPSSACFTCHKQLVKDAEWRHSPAVGVLCKSCHQQSEEENKIIVHTDDIDNLCFRCHINGNKWGDYASVHGPVGTGDCTVCHSPHGDSYRHYLWADGKLDLCLACHRDKKKLFATDPPLKSVHGIIKGAGCTVCHSPHASKYPFQLHKSINSLCNGCHATIGELGDNHPVEGHPVEGADDPNRSGREMSCTSCHKPHGSSYSLLLIGEKIGGRVCSKCHS